MFNEISERVRNAADKRGEIAMFHLQVLIHADQLAKYGAIDFCRAVKVPASYATEFRKMIGLARLMKKQGLRIRE